MAPVDKSPQPLLSENSLTASGLEKYPNASIILLLKNTEQFCYWAFVQPPQ